MQRLISVVSTICIMFVPGLGDLTASAKIATSKEDRSKIIQLLSCEKLVGNAFWRAGWREGSAPYSIPIEQWTVADFNLLDKRFNACEVEAGYDFGHGAGTRSYIDNLASRAIDPDGQGRHERETAKQNIRAAQNQVEAGRIAEATAERQRVAANMAAQQRAAMEESDRIMQGMNDAASQPIIVANCALPEMLSTVKRAIEQQSNSAVLKLYRAVPNPTFAAYVQADEAGRARARWMFAKLPQCNITAITSSGEHALAYRVFNADGELFVEIVNRID